MLSVDYARQQMIHQQVRAWQVLDNAVLNVLGEVKREDFVPAAYRHVAFADSPIPLGHGQHMLTPKVEGKLLQALSVSPTDEILEIGAGSGFVAACLGRLGAHVRSLEIFPDLAETARANLHRAAANNVAVEVADGMQIDDEKRYDVIAVTGSVPIFDPRLQRALKVGGRLFVTVGSGPVMEACRIVRHGEDRFTTEPLFETVIDPLINAARPSGFVF